MKDQVLLYTFILSCLTTWLFLILFYRLFLNRRRLFKKGYSLEYIKFIRSDYRKRMRGIAIAIPVLLLIAFGIYWLIAGKPESFNQLTYVFVIFLILVIPFPILDYYKSKKLYKKLAVGTNAEVVIDIKNLKLHKFFNPFIELLITALFIAYTVLLIQLPYIVYIHLAIPWILYLAIKRPKYTTQPMLRDGYLYSFIFMELNYALVIFYIARYGLFCQSCLSNDNKLLSLLLMAIMFSRMIFYMMIFRRVYHSLSR